MKDAVKLLAAPGSVPFFVISILIGLICVRFTRRFRRFGAAVVAAVSSAYVIMALPIVGLAIANALPRVETERPDRIATLIVLDGDNRRGRVREVRRVMKTERPEAVWVLGGEWILNALTEAGISGQVLHHDGTAPTTLAQIAQVQDIANRSAAPTVVVASRLQAPRVMALIRSHRIRATLLASAVDDEPATSGLRRFMPQYAALRVSRDAIYEHVALAYYRYRRFVDR